MIEIIIQSAISNEEQILHSWRDLKERENQAIALATAGSAPPSVISCAVMGRSSSPVGRMKRQGKIAAEA